MAAGPTGQTTVRRRKTLIDGSTCWSNSLKEIAGLLPISEPRNGRGFTKKETMIHMLRYFDFLQDKIQTLQGCLPPPFLPQEDTGSGTESEENTPSEPSTPPQTLKAKRKYACSCARNRPPQTTVFSHAEVEVEIQEEGQSSPMCGVQPDCSELQASYEEWSVDDSSMDSTLSLSPPLPLTTPLEGSSGVLWSPPGVQCSVCEDPTGSESSPGSVVFDTPPTGPKSLLLKDRMFGVVLPVRGRRKPFLSPAATPTRPCLLSLLPLLGTGENLNLSPSLLTSPARGLNHCLLPEGQEELQALFEDVWVTPKTTNTRVFSRPRYDSLSEEDEEEVAAPPGSGGGRSSQSEGEEGDVTWTPELKTPLKKTSRRQRGYRNKSTTRGRPLNAKKKCINGFIMFCRVNRKTYLRTHPGTPSTVVTKELASLWHVMPKQERRVYCLKARRFSRQHNRNVKSEEDEEEEEEECMPSPLHMLLAYRDLFCH